MIDRIHVYAEDGMIVLRVPDRGTTYVSLMAARLILADLERAIAEIEPLPQFPDRVDKPDGATP